MSSLLDDIKNKLFGVPPDPNTVHYQPMPPSSLQSHAAALAQQNADLQNQLAATQANQQMMASMLQNQQQFNQQMGQPMGGGGGGAPGNLTQVYTNLSMDGAAPQGWDDTVEDKVKDDKDTLTKLLEAKVHE